MHPNKSIRLWGILTMALAPSSQVFVRSFSTAFVRPNWLLGTRQLCRNQHFGRALTAANDNNNNHNDNNYYNAPPRRKFSAGESWEVPKSVDIPVEKIDLSFTRSSGSGGQNVNKVNTKVELRFDVMEADWIPLEVRQRLYQQQRTRINKKGMLSVTSQEFRTQEKNRRAAVGKLEGLILEAWPRPKERKMRKGISKAAKERNKETKRRRSEIKKSRKPVSSKDF